MRQGLSALLEADGHFCLVGGAKTGREAADMALLLRPDVIVMDIAMPGLTRYAISAGVIEGRVQATVEHGE